MTPLAIVAGFQARRLDGRQARAGAQDMTRFESDGQTARIAAATTGAGLPEPLSWPAAAALIFAVSLALWVVIGFGINALIG